MGNTVIKQLTWDQRSPNCWTASSMFGSLYSITRHPGLPSPYMLDGGGNFFVSRTYHDTLDLAQTTAYEDCVKRVHDMIIDVSDISDLILSIQWARNRLETIADESWRGDARDFKRSLVGVFADFDDIIEKINRKV